MRSFRLVRLAAILATLALAGRLSAQLQWSVFNETTSTTAPASTATSGVAVTVPAGQRVTLVANNYVPFDLSAAGSEQVAAISFKVSGGLSSISSGTLAVGFGLFNSNGTPANYADDSGYFTWLNGRNTGALIQQRRRIGDGSSTSLLNATGPAVTNLSTGQSTLTSGALSDGNTYAIQFRLQGRNGSIAFGSGSATAATAGIWVSGPGLSATTYSNPDAPAATFVFNEIGFMFLNSTSSDVTLTIGSVTGLTPINPPAASAQPAAISLNPGQAGALTVGATGTPPLAYQWKKDGTTIAGATAATYAIPNAATADAGSYTVDLTNAYGSATSNAAAVTITASPIPATITNQPTSLTVNAGQNASFSVAVFGSSPLAYQWQKNGTAIAGATTNTIALTNVSAVDAANYTVVVSNGASSVTSAVAALGVNTAPVITTQPVGVTTAVGQSVTFSVAATGSPAPTYQWQRNGAAIAGATSAALTISNVALTHAGVYTVSLLNSVGAVTSASALLAIPSAMTATAVAPAVGATGVNLDTPLSITFDRTPSIGATGRIRIFKASDNSVVDTLDLGVKPITRTIGTQVNYVFYPVIVTGNTAAIYPRAGVLAYGQSYYVQLEIGVISDSTGASFTGINDTTTWAFTTKAAGPAANANAVTVAADGSGDFTTVQGAIDFVPSGNTQRVVITVRKGTYTEMNYVSSTKPFITVQGDDRAQTILQYANNNAFNTLNGNNRAMFSVDASDFTLQTITLKNLTPQGGSQAEAYRGNGLRHILNRVNLLSRQDTLLINGSNCTAFITDSYIEGNTDFMWGSGAVYMQRTELKALDTGTATEGYYTQIRNGATQFGNVYVDCKLTAADGVVGKSIYYLGRIDPGVGNFPYSQCLYLNCALGAHISPAGWLLNNATSSPTIQYWEYKNTDLNGATLDITKRISSSRQLSDSEATLWRNPAFVLGGWNPQVATSIETPPASQSVTAGSIARLSVVANGAPQPALQWFKNGAAIPGATDYTLVIPGVQPGDVGNYTVTATNLSGTVTSAAATLTVTRGAFAGTYFGTMGTGNFALYVRDNGTGVFLATGASGGAIVSRSVAVDGSGAFNFGSSSSLGAVVSGAIDANGNVTGAFGTTTLSGSRSGSGGISAAFAGYYQTGASSGAAATANLIVGSGGQAFALVQNGATLDGGTGTVDANGNFSVTTVSGAKVAATIASNGSSASATVTPAGGTALATAGAGDAASSAQRLRQFSARAQVTPKDGAAVGFIITGGTDSVLVRAIGPTLADAFSVPGALTNPRLDLYRGSTLIASNTNWTTALNATEAAFAASQAGAFPLRTAAADSALRLSLAPGAYTATANSANGTTTGIALIEVYDLSVGAAGQRLVNVSTRGVVGNGANALFAGFQVVGTQPKRLLVRGVGPGLAAFAVNGVVAKPVLSIYRGTTLVAQNIGWTTSADALAITSAAIEAVTFPLVAANADSAIVVNLMPGVYTVQITSLDAAGGIGLIEIYELP